MPGVNGQIGLVPPTLNSMPASAGLKLPRNGGAAFGGLSDTIRLVAPHAEQSQPVLYGGVRVKPDGLQGTEAFRGILYPLSGSWLAAVETSMSDESLLPRRYSLASQVHATLGRDWNLSIGLKHSVYDTGGAFGFPGIGGSVETPAGYSLAPTLYPGYTSATSYQLKFNYLYDTRNRVGLAYTGGRDDDLYSPLDRPLRGAHQFMLTGQHWLAPNWALNYNVYTPESGNLLQRQGLRLGLRYRF